MINGFTLSLSKPVVMILFITSHIFVTLQCCLVCHVLQFYVYLLIDSVLNVCFIFCDYFYIHWLLQPCMDQMECKNKDERFEILF
jgi:hypothetical protein